MHVYTYIHVYIYIYIHIHTHIYTYNITAASAVVVAFRLARNLRALGALRHYFIRLGDSIYDFTNYHLFFNNIEFTTRLWPEESSTREGGCLGNFLFKHIKLYF